MKKRQKVILKPGPYALDQYGHILEESDRFEAYYDGNNYDPHRYLIDLPKYGIFYKQNFKIDGKDRRLSAFSIKFEGYYDEVENDDGDLVEEYFPEEIWFVIVKEDFKHRLMELL